MRKDQNKRKITNKDAIGDQSAIVYQAKNGAIELRGDASRETVWATQAQIADIFGSERSVVTRHVNNVLKSGEVDKKSNVQKMHIAYSDKLVAFYSLDIILSVGYRVNSARAIEFRRWATKTLREHITRGYTINRKRVAANYASFIKAVNDVKRLLPAGASVNNEDVLELISAFADTWLSLEAYDKDELAAIGATKKSVLLTAEQLADSLAGFKRELRSKGEATEMFGQERHTGSVAGIVGSVMQSFDGKPLYATVEEKAAHLLYFMVKNHPFADGNKRSGAYAFVWFLNKAGTLDRSKITPQALTALTILTAESAPSHKEKVVHLILQLLKKQQ